MKTLTNQIVLNLLRKFPLLADVPDEDLALLANESTVQHYDREQIIFYQEDPCDRVWMVYSGRVKIVYHDRDGREVILELISPGEVFGGAVLFFPSQPATAKAMEPVTLLNFPAQAYSRFLLNRPAVILKLLRMLGARHLSMINMQTMVGERVERRMAHILLKLAIRVGRETSEGRLISIPLSRQDLADMVCTTLETSIRTVSRFRKDGVLETRRGGFILIKDLDRLRQMTE
jgi:CRP/FNR family transcriptional regulator